LKSLQELPPLAELKAMGDINLQLDLSGVPTPAQESAYLPEADSEEEEQASDDSQGAPGLVASHVDPQD